MICRGCKKTPSEISEYIKMGEIENMTPEDFVRYEEGTFNPKDGSFWCTDCYSNAGMPLNDF